MAKLGKKARKFAKKNLQSVLKRKRKLNSKFNKKSSKRAGRDEIEEQEEDTRVLSNARIKGQDFIDYSLDTIFTDEDSNVAEDDFDSDGYLPEDSSLHIAQIDSETYQEDGSCGSDFSLQNREIYSELLKKTKKLDRLKKKDPKFSKFLESHDKERKAFKNEDYSDEDEMSVDETELANEGGNSRESSLFTRSAIDSLCELVVDQQNISALTSLLNGYRTACRYGAESSGFHNSDSSHRFQSSEAYSKILMFVLNDADGLFKKLLGLSGSKIKKEKLSELKSTSKWTSLKPLIKSYLRSTLFLLNQVTETEILIFSIARARASIDIYVAFPSLLRRLVKIAIQFWATGGGSVSPHAFGIVRDLASVYSSDWFDFCFIKTYKSFISHCQFVEHVQLKHVQYLRNSFVELCSIDVQKSSRKAITSIQQLAKILHQGIQTKKKEAVKCICSWPYISCIDLWVSFISANIQDYDLQQLLFSVIQIINGTTLLFHGPRYLPLRVKCIQWLNNLSRSSGIFIPVASLILDVLEYKIGEGAKSGTNFSLSSSIKLPKHLLKTQKFQEQCILSAIELLSAHFAQWSYHISLPELATIPLICLRKFQEIITVESFKRVVKRFIDQVEQNIEFVQKKRDEVAFSPKDQPSTETFLQLEKHNSQTPFTQYYKSIMEKAVSRNLGSNEKFPVEKLLKKVKKPPNMVTKSDVNCGDSVK